MTEQWETHKEEILQLYLEIDKTVKEIKDHMQQRHSFQATLKQYHYQLKKWNARKNLTKDEWARVGRRFTKRKLEDGKESELRIEGRLMPFKKIKKGIGRYAETALEKAKRELRERSKTPDGCLVSTPPTSVILSPEPTGMRYVVLENSPLLQFQRFMASNASTFGQAFSRFTGTSSVSSGLQSSLEISPESSRHMQYNTLVMQTAHESFLAEVFPTMPHKIILEFLGAVHHASNYTDHASTLGKPFIDIMMTIVKSVITKSAIPQLEKSPTLDALVEVTFRYALEGGHTDSVELLVMSGMVGPDDLIPHQWRGPRLPLEIAAERRDFVMVELLIRLGASLNIHTLKGQNILINLARYASEEFLQDILDRGLVDTLTAIATFQDLGFLDLLKTVLEKTIQTHPVLAGKVALTRKDIDFASSILRHAVSSGDPRITKKVLAVLNHLDIAREDQEDRGFVFLAVEARSLETTRLLVEAGASVNTRGQWSILPLTLAILTKQSLLAKALLNYGAYPEERWNWVDVPLTPLQAAVYRGDFEMASLLISQGAKVNAPLSTLSQECMLRLGIDQGYPILYESAFSLAANIPNDRDCLQMVQLLVENGADMTIFTHRPDEARRMRNMEQGFEYLFAAGAPFAEANALHFAAQRGDIQYLEFAVENGVSLDALDFDSHTPVYLAIFSSILSGKPGLKFQTVSYLIDKGASLHLPEHRAVDLGMDFCRLNPELVEMLLRNGAYVNPLGYFSLHTDGVEQLEEALRYASSMNPHPIISYDPCFGHFELEHALEQGRFDVVQALLAGGVCMTRPCAVTAVQRACMLERSDILQQLLSLGAPLHVQQDFQGNCWGKIIYSDEYSNTPLQIAAKSGRTDIAQLLLRENASISAIAQIHDPDDTFDSYLLRDVYNGKVDHVYSCESTLCCAVEGGLDMVKLIQQAGADINEPAAEFGGRTAIQKAAQLGNLEIVEYLIKEKADINAAPAKIRGVTALQAAAINSHFDIAYRLLEEEANPNASGAEEDGRTALEGAAERGRIDIIQLLLENGADILSGEFGDDQFDNALDLAESEGYYAAARLLECHREEPRS